MTWEPDDLQRRCPLGMPTPKEFRKNADDCLKLARETNEIYAKMALIEMATEFRVMAQHLERDPRSRLPSPPRRLRLRAADVLRLRSSNSRSNGN
jgi:hypothetical protein